MFSLLIPPESDSFTDDYCILEVKKSGMLPFYNKKQQSIENEESFIEYLETKDSIEWWYKNGESSKEYFAVPYNSNKSLFYPDWFIKLKNGHVLILDTKAGFTATLEETNQKIKALHAYIKEKELNNYQAGIVVKYNDIWKINIKDRGWHG